MQITASRKIRKTKGFFKVLMVQWFRDETLCLVVVLESLNIFFNGKCMTFYCAKANGQKGCLNQAVITFTSDNDVKVSVDHN